MPEEIEPKHPGGRPTKRTSKITERICEGISYGLTDEEVAALVGIDDSTLTRWKKDPEFCGAIKRAMAIRKLDRLKRIESGDPGWQGTAWAIERQYPEQFSRPEIQLSLKLAENREKQKKSAMEWEARVRPEIAEFVKGIAPISYGVPSRHG
jgi:hypothetical protein